ncbi:peptidoglycan-binding protein [Sporosarcina globispora]|uniref:Peptidoglycan-binding protein n=1 Tax=Sporosarcina globispora TaxID=1459 RepID=A0A0M0GGC0_SPOGL|nr:peptidoglycan-binding protein [Sporosarcina globispora]KON88838.1 peptidoglycan-binding protein [Sporosarcina globispora]
MDYLYKRQSTGKLMVFLFEGDKARPVKGATVTITGNNQSITLQTDESGQTQTVTLPAIDPYSEYSASVTAEGYAPVNLHGIQVFPNASGIQEIQLTPIRQGIYRPTEEYTISPHNLTTPDPNKETVNPLNIPEPPQTGQTRPNGPPVGLLIPEYIIVHCGAPNDRSAPNHRVKYTDYLTKVASAEIFSNWNKEALIANILCINSYALNKIFTQYYEGFDVTCLIQFDQKYDPRQTTYKEIIEVVDTIFNQYIKHPDPNLKQPFYAEFRANPQRRCIFGQNKSQLLALQGKKHLDIIKHFYEECYRPMAVTSTAGVIFQGRPTAPPATILKEGSRGSDVREIQVFLHQISNKYPSIPKLQVDGNFQKRTKEAVEAFQKVFFLPQSGEVDFRTWYKISNLYYSILEYRDIHESKTYL